MQRPELGMMLVLSVKSDSMSVVFFLEQLRARANARYLPSANLQPGLHRQRNSQALSEVDHGVIRFWCYRSYNLGVCPETAAKSAKCAADARSSPCLSSRS